jgi:hypothetical protein
VCCFFMEIHVHVLANACDTTLSEARGFSGVAIAVHVTRFGQGSARMGHEVMGSNGRGYRALGARDGEEWVRPFYGACPRQDVQPCV